VTDSCGHARHRGAQSPNTRTIIDAARQPGGVTIAAASAMCGWPVEQAGSRLALMVRRGKLHRGAVPGHRVRFFASLAAALEWAQGTAPIVQPEPAAARQKASSRHLGDAARRLLDLAALPGGITAVGAVSTLQALGLTANTSTASARLDALARHGHLTRATAAGQRNRYFRTDEAATAWLAQFGPPALETHECRGLVPQPEEREVIVPDTVKITRISAPAFNTRFQVDPQSRPFGAGFAAAGLGRDVTTGEAWGR
jgi:hypothetical protein